MAGTGRTGARSMIWVTLSYCLGIWMQGGIGLSRAGYIPAKSWADYDRGDPNKLSRDQLVDVVRRSAKAANQRLLRFERAGHTKGMYKSAMRNLAGRRRYQERPEKLSLSQLRHEYTILRSFLSAKTSTIQGRRDTIMRRYAKAVSKGYTGTLEEFEFAVEKYFSDKIEKYYDSNVIYTSIVHGRTNIIDKVVEQQEASGKDPNKGTALIAYLRYKPKDVDLL